MISDGFQNNFTIVKLTVLAVIFAQKLKEINFIMSREIAMGDTVI